MKKPTLPDTKIKSNTLVEHTDNQIKETSRFGGPNTIEHHKERVERIPKVKGNTPVPVNNDGTNSDLDKIISSGHTLSLSFAGNDHDSNYMIYDSAYGASHGYKASKKPHRLTRQRINKYRSKDNEDANSSQFDGVSQNSRGSYRIEYLISKAFTPIVPSDNYLNEISKISWNRRDLLDNISYSGITESILIGRNTSLRNTGAHNTDQMGKKGRSLIWQSKEHKKTLIPSFKSPQPRGNRVTQPLQYQRSLSNEQRTISSIAGTQMNKFPPIGFDSNNLSDSMKDSVVSKRVTKSRKRERSLDHNTLGSPTNMNIRTKNDSRVSLNAAENASQKSSKHSRGKTVIYKNQIIHTNFRTLDPKQNVDVSETLDQHRPLIKYTPSAIEQETPRLPSQTIHFRNNSFRSSKPDGVGSSRVSHRRRITPKKDTVDERSEISYKALEDNDGTSQKNELKGYLESSIPRKKKKEDSKHVYAIETVGQIEGESPDHSHEERKSLISQRSSARGKIERRYEPQSQRFDYAANSMMARNSSIHNDTRVLNPSTRIDNQTRNQNHEQTNSSDTTQKNFNEKEEPPKCYTKVSYLRKQISFDDCNVSPIPGPSQR